MTEKLQAQNFESRKCQKCGEPTKSEEALVDGQIWCHPCADESSQPPTKGDAVFDPRDTGFSLEDDGRICRFDDPDCRHPDCDCARYVKEQRAYAISRPDQ